MGRKSMLESIPAEVAFGGVYFPPLFFVIIMGVISAYGVTVVLNRTGVSKYFWHPPLAFMALILLMTALIGLIIFSP